MSTIGRLQSWLILGNTELDTRVVKHTPGRFAPGLGCSITQGANIIPAVKWARWLKDPKIGYMLKRMIANREIAVAHDANTVNGGATGPIEPPEFNPPEYEEIC